MPNNINSGLAILLVEDDPDLSALIMDYLEMEGVHCENAPNGLIGLKLAKQTEGIEYDAIILDINLPLLDGLALCRELRKNKVSTPIIMLTARDTLEDKLKGFAEGTNDYLCKPFEMRELVARIKAMTRTKFPQEVLQCADLSMNLQTCRVMRGEREICLTQTEWKILHLLLTNSPKAVSKKRLLTEIWGDEPPESDSLKVHMHNLRKNIDGPNLPLLLHTIPGMGYAIKENI